MGISIGAVIFTLKATIVLCQSMFLYIKMPLQGFPDDWTRWGDYDGEVKEIARTNRYKMIGNSVTVDVVAAVAKKLIIR